MFTALHGLSNPLLFFGYVRRDGSAFWWVGEGIKILFTISSKLFLLGHQSLLYNINSLPLLMTFLSADNVLKQLQPRSGPTKHQVRFRSKLFDSLMVFLRENFEKKFILKKKKKQQTKKHAKLPSMQR